MHRNRVKICGLTRFDQALEIAQLGVGAIGFIFYPPSPRYIAPEQAKKICDALPPFVQKIGVFVDAPFDEVVRVASQLFLDKVQLHGKEDPAYTQELSQRGVGWLKAFRVGPDFDFTLLERYAAPYVLLDSKVEKVFGGSGQPIDWQALPKERRGKQWILSGGLNLGNIEQAVRIVRPAALDVSSGVESAPGVKDLAKVRAFLTKIDGLADPATILT